MKLKDYVCNKTGRVFQSNRGLLNHLIKQYESIEEAYVMENNITFVTKCKYCDNKAKFKSFKDGYRETCGDDICVGKLKKFVNRTLANKRLDKFIDGLYENVLLNKEYYRLNSEVKNIVEPFSNINIGNIKLKTFIKLNVVNFNSLTEERVCEYCNNIFSTNILLHKIYCSDKSCVSYRTNNKSIPKEIDSSKLKDLNFVSPKGGLLKYQKDIIFNNLFLLIKNTKTNKTSIKSLFEYMEKLFDIINIKYTYKINKDFSVLVDSNNTTRRYIEDNNIDLFNMLYTNNCIICGEMYRLSSKKRIFCSHSCYYEAFKHPDLYTRDYPQEARDRQSTFMKNRILSGDFIVAKNGYINCRIYYNNNKYRSTWDFMFHILNPTFEYETVIIPYQIDNTYKNYITDYYDNINSIIYEVKPSNQIDNKVVKAKERYTIEYCEQNNLKYEFITETYFKNNLILLYNKIKELREEIGDVNFVKVLKVLKSWGLNKTLKEQNEN